jgi:dolichol-phosphate mannosyltransferase
MTTISVETHQNNMKTQVEFSERYEFKMEQRPFLSVITPAYNEVENLPKLYERLADTLNPMQLDWEWIIVDDHSSDQTFAVINELADHDKRIRGYRFARNFGAHKAITFGMHNAKGNCAAIMAADLQDPPETLPLLLEKWKDGSQVVWAVRAQREGEKASTIGFSRVYYWLMRNVVGINDMPATGADFFLIDRRVIDALSEFAENNTSLLALITWMGFRQSEILYDKQARLYGSSGWNLEKKLKLVVDSVTSFTYLPIRLMSYLGVFIAMFGFIYAAIVVANAIAGRPVEGWSSLMVVVLVVGGIQMLMMGVLGEYLWRALDEARHRPRFIVEEDVGGENEQKRPFVQHANANKIPMVVPEQ